MENVGNADHVVQILFQKKLAIEAKFLMQMSRTSLDSSNRVVVEGEGHVMQLVIVTSDDKVPGVLTEIEQNGVGGGKAQAVVSPLLSGKREYMKWVQDSLN